MGGFHDERIAQALERIASVLEAQEARAQAKIESDDVLRDQNATRAARLMIKMHDKTDEPLAPSVFALARRPLLGDPVSFTIGDEVTFDGGLTWRKEPVRRESR